MKKKDIPNIITAIRILLSPIIVPIMWSGNVILGSTLFILTAVTDFADGYLARKLHAKSVEGKYLDAIADKEFSILVLLSLVPFEPVLLLCILLEVSIAYINTQAFEHHIKPESSKIGKLKTAILSGAMGTNILTHIIPAIVKIPPLPIMSIINKLITASTLLLEMGTGIEYISEYQKKDQEKIENDLPETTVNEEEMDHYMKNFTFYQPVMKKSPKIMKLYQSYFIPEIKKLEKEQEVIPNFQEEKDKTYTLKK